MNLCVDGMQGASTSASSTYVRELGAIDWKTDTVPRLVEECHPGSPSYLVTSRAMAGPRDTQPAKASITNTTHLPVHDN